MLLVIIYYYQNFLLILFQLIFPLSLLNTFLFIGCKIHCYISLQVIVSISVSFIFTDYNSISNSRIFCNCDCVVIPNNIVDWSSFYPCINKLSIVQLWDSIIEASTKKMIPFTPSNEEIPCKMLSSTVISWSCLINDFNFMFKKRIVRLI